MSSISQHSRYPALSIVLHWVMALLIAGVYACILLRENFPKGSDLRDGLKTWHFMLGLSVLVLAIIRIVVQASSTTPPIIPTPPAWQAVVAKLTHVALYAFMLAMPLAGWTILSASGAVIPFFGLELPALVGQSKPQAAQIKELHETVGTIGYFLIGLHAAAALFHHYLIKDNTLLRMIKFRHDLRSRQAG